MVFTHYTECDKIVCRCCLAFQLYQACTARGAGSWGPSRTWAGQTHWDRTATILTPEQVLGACMDLTGTACPCRMWAVHGVVAQGFAGGHMCEPA